MADYAQTNTSQSGVSLYYLAVTDFSLAFALPLVGPAGFGRLFPDAVPEEDCAAGSCEALRRIVVVVLGGSMGTVGARTERGCLDGPALCGEGLSVLQWAELRLRRVPNRARRGIRGLPDVAGAAEGRGQEAEGRGQDEEERGNGGFDLHWVLKVLSPIF